MRLPVLAVAAFLLACSSREEVAPRLGFFPNITHAQALVGQADGTFAREQPLGKVDFRQFNAGPAAMEALLSGSLDAAYVGPGPAINAFLKGGKSLRVLAGAVNGGVAFVGRERFTPQELRGKRIGTPQLGNSQDIALRYWLKAQGMSVPLGLGGDVNVVPLSNADILSLFQRGKLDGAWVPEPWGSRLIEAGGVLLLDERDLWPGGQFPATLLVTTDEVLKKRPREIEALLRAHVQLTRRWERSPQAFEKKVNEAFGALVGKPLPAHLTRSAFSRMSLTLEPSREALAESARHAHAVGFLRDPDVTGLVDDRMLRKLLESESPAPAAARRAPPAPR